MFGFKKELYTPEYQLAGDECAVIETSKGTIDPNTRDMSGADVAAGLEGPDGMPGTGGPGYCIKGEFATNPRNSHVDGALAMARSMDPDSAGSQFYFCLGAQHNLDSGYTVFGTTVEGLDVISQLRAGDEIVHVEIVHE